MHDDLKYLPDDMPADAAGKASKIRQWKRGWFRPLDKPPHSPTGCGAIEAW